MDLRPLPFNLENIFIKKKKKKKKRIIKRYKGPNLPLYKAMWPIIYIVRVFGYSPYDFSQDRLVPSNVNLSFTIIAVILYNYIVYNVLTRIWNIKRETSSLGKTENAKVTMNYITTMYELGLTAFMRRSFVRIWNALQDYDEEIRQLGHSRKEIRTAIGAWILLIVNSIIWISINRSGMYAFAESWTYNVGYMLPYIGTSVAIYKFVAVAIFLGQRFHHLNTIATKNLPSVRGDGTVISKQTILSLHNDLMIAAENLESLYSWSLFLWLANLTLHAVSNLYFVIQWLLVKPWEVQSWPLVFCFSSWLLVFLVQLFLIHIACDFVSSQASYISAILIEWQARTMKKNEEEYDVETSLQFLNRRLKFSAGGCFNVNLPLLRSIASTMTTYLVILLQLQ
ncbi:uncharacterized protein LOC105833673 isoform X2 [Monomorium pharaonis]|uniref:uncharacterized protein LOC105833673 isoform X2 n=1 Tax=Monomorium pharaonis TaxID=307658 RepID=UPI00063EF5F5|nr:uncharacterized protein LOC105833673 isoform X2 [Monomorium pharaonis]